MGTAALPRWAAVDAAIAAGSGAALSFLECLIAEPSTVGEEQAAQELVAAELARLGFGVSWLEIPAETAAGFFARGLPPDGRPRGGQPADGHPRWSAGREFPVRKADQ